jgi:hypothetical protein
MVKHQFKSLAMKMFVMPAGLMKGLGTHELKECPISLLQ